MGEFFYFTLNHCGHPANIAFFDCAMAVTEGFAPKTVRAGSASSPAKQLHCFYRGLESSSEQSREGHFRWDVLLTTKWSC